MNRAAFAQPIVTEEDTGSVRFHFKGVFTFQKSFPHLAIGQLKMPGQPIDIDGGQIQGRPLLAITANPWAVIAKYQVHRLFFHFLYLVYYLCGQVKG
jgi:hypothetical protein